MTAKCLLESYYGESMATASVVPQNIPAYWHNTTPRRWMEQSLREESGIIHLQSGLSDPGNAEQMRAIRILGANLRGAADGMRIGQERNILDINVPALRREGLSNEEIRVVRRINTSTTISNIARYLQECLTSQTFRMALVFLSSTTASPYELLAAACEIARLLYPRVQEAFQAGPIWDELQRFIENRLDEVLH